MKSNVEYLVFRLVLVVVASTASHAQSSATPEWHTILSSGEDFSVTLPVGYLVHKDSRTRQVALIGSAGGVSFEVTLRNTSGAVGQLERMHDTPPEKGERSAHMIDDSRVHLYTYQGTKIFRMSISTATKRGLYSLGLSAPSRESEVLTRILASLRLRGREMVKDPKVQAPIGDVILKADTLSSSDIVKAALKRKQTGRVIVDQAPASNKPEDKEEIYSRRLIIVDKPFAGYNERAKKDGIQGAVRVRILFKGDGNIGKVTILKGLPSGLNEEVVHAVRRIKFVPAEINGIPADAERTLEYTFSIY